MTADRRTRRLERTLHLFLVIVMCAIATPGEAQTLGDSEPDARPLPADARIDVDALLAKGDMASAVADLEAWCRAHPDDQRARFGLGWARALEAFESVARDLHRHGATLHHVRWWLAFLLVPFFAAPLEHLPEQPDPAPTTYADVRHMLLRFERNLASAAETLEACDLGDDGVVLRPGRFAIGLYPAEDQVDIGPPRMERVPVVRWLGLLPRVTDTALEQLVVRFDQADVRWLAGYCHALAAPASLALAVDGRDVFDHAGHLLFPRAVQTHAFLKDLDDDHGWSSIEDLIAAIHVARLPVTAPEQMTATLAHLEGVLDHSDAMWAAIDAEADDDQEWIPSTTQSGPLGSDLDADTRATWSEVLVEVRRLLDGETLLPFWRGENTTRGVNLRRVFVEPTSLDPVLWMQGTAAAPYLEEGTITSLADGQLWRRLEAVFGGHPAELALWVN